MKSLLVHIGTGKTGSTAIQRALNSAASALQEQGIHYWGLNLEGCHKVNQTYQWQKESGTPVLQQLSVTEAKQQLRKALDLTLASLNDNELAIWSNESIAERPDAYIPAIKEASEAASVNLTIVCYVRSHRSFANSAYKQWGIKHKTYQGRILSFQDWVRSRISFLSYGRQVAMWDATFGNRMRLFNYDAITDVVEHFSGLIPTPKPLELPSQRANKSPGEALLALFALYNNQNNSPVGPTAIQDLQQRYQLIKSNHKIIDLADLFPSSERLSEAEELLKEDSDLVNRLLRQHGQPELNAKAGSDKAERLTTDSIQSSLLSMLLKMLITQDERIQLLEQQLKNQTARPSTD